MFVCLKSEKVRKAELIKDNVEGIVFDAIYTKFQKKKSVHFVFGDFPLPTMFNVHVFGTKIKIRTCTL